MPKAKEIRTKIRSVKSTQKITRAMEMVAASKMRKAQERMRKGKPYAHKIREVIAHLAEAHPEYKHPFLEVRKIYRTGFIIVSSDRGLCGGLNTNLFKVAIHAMRDFQEKDITSELCLIGTKSEVFFRHKGGTVVASANHLGDAPKVQDLIGLVRVMLDKYISSEIDALYICYNEFVSTMVQKPVKVQLLPIVSATAETEARRPHWDYLYEPDAKTLLTTLLTRYVESQVYQAVVENFACQQAATMIAMKSATDNAGNIIEGLNLAYNKARQASITQEINEIISGAEAVA